MISRSEFDKKYTTCSLLGKGGFGAVYAGYRNTDHFPVAIKVINKNRIMSTSGTNEHRVPMEVALMKITNHIEGKNCVHTLMFQNKQKNILRYLHILK